MLIGALIALALFIIKLLKPKECQPGYFFPEDSKNECHQCSIENCGECSGTKDSNICSSCLPGHFSIFENNTLKFCNSCVIGEDDKCFSCDKEINKCSKCNSGYKLENGKCVLNYSFKAKYFSHSNNPITLFNYID